VSREAGNIGSRPTAANPGRNALAPRRPTRDPREGVREGSRDAGRDTDPFRQTWQGMLTHLRQNHPTICRQWFEDLEPLGIEGGALELRVGTNIHRDYLRRSCSDAFNDAARTVSQRLLSVRFLGPNDVAMAPGAGAIALRTASGSPAGLVPPAPVVVEPLTPPEPALPLEPIAPRTDAGASPGPSRYETLVVNPDYSFENFVVGPNNRLAHAAALAVAANPGRSYNPFFVHGGVGLGKTHLLQAICLRIVEANPDAILYYTSCEGFVTQFIESVQSNQMSQFRHRFRDVDVLIIDDIHFLTKRDRSQEEFFHTFNSLFQQQKQIILSSDAPPEEIPDLEERLVSRFKWGLVTKIDAPEYETRIQILKTKARLRDVPLPDEVAEFIALRVDSNIRELEGVVVKLQIQAIVEKSPITIDMAKAAIGERPVLVPTEPAIETIIGVVTDFYGLRLSDLQSKQRQRSIALPRHVCMYLARKCTRRSLEEIGGFFGGRDHTTVMHAIKTVDAKLATDEEFVAVLKLLEDRTRQAR
jgi:chromosomal replication initiator protein